MLRQAGHTPFEAQRALSGEPLTLLGQRKLETLCRIAGLGNAESVLRMFDVLTGGWDPPAAGLEPEWKSDVSDDHTPFAFSLALGGGPAELGMLVEAQASPMTLKSGWEAALALNNRLHSECGVCLDRFERVHEMFVPRWSGARFSLWHEVCFRAGEGPRCKVYLNPASLGPQAAGMIVKETLSRLRFDYAWSFLDRVLRSGKQNRLAYFALDLHNREFVKVEVYIAHGNATAGDVDRALAMSGRHVYEPGMAQALCREWSGHEGPFEGPPLLSSYAFTSGCDVLPDAATFHFPARGAFYCAPAGEFAASYVSAQRQGGHLRSTIQLATEACAAEAPRASTKTAVC